MMPLKPLHYYFILALVLISCKQNSNEKTTKTTEQTTSVIFQNKAHELVCQMVQKVGNYEKLRAQKDVQYTYTYVTPDGKTDISTEKYLFDGELSYGYYQQHQRTLPQLEGVLEQSYDGHLYWVKANGKLVTDPAAIKRAQFSRPTNFYWFSMFQKLLDPGLKYAYLGEKQQADTTYDVVKVTFDNSEKPTDIYQLYINKTTGLVDQFLFTVVDFGKVETPLLMQMTYEEINGFLIPTKRRYKMSTWDAEVTDSPWINVTWTNIQFNNGLTPKDFMK